jgi:lysophospholipase L1-like esterase
MATERTICVFGSSIAWGAYDPEGGWVQRLRRHLEELGSSSFPFVTVYNLGVNDDTSTDVLKRFLVEAGARRPDTIIFEIGINDSQYVGVPESRRTPLDQFRSNVQQLIARAKTLTSSIYFLGLTEVDEAQTTPISWMPGRFYRNDRIAEYDAALRETVQAEGGTLIPLDGTLALEDLDDGLHPNAAGHEKIFRAVLATIEKGLPAYKAP